MQQFIDKVEKQTLVSDFTFTVAEGMDQPISYNGALKMRGDRFRLNLFGIEAAYDGKTFYSYSDDTNELALTTPSPEELLEANPVLYAKALLKTSVVQFSSSLKRTDCYCVELVPTSKTTGVDKLILIVRKSDFIPVEVRMKEPKRQTTVSLKNTKYQTNIPSFVLSKEDAWLNDLR